ncbi:MAG: hypothetical protein E3J64_05985 [Anaerolineales bacterium]|nr:MAG: hypothetical protein E3J64_05985 [Anaerolineales bacterium]
MAPAKKPRVLILQPTGANRDAETAYAAELARFIESGKPVLSVCNGFQALVKSGWLAVAAAEMAFAGRLGMELALADLPRVPEVTVDDVAFFSESSARFLVGTAPKDAASFKNALAGQPTARLGRITDTGVLLVRGLSGSTAIDCPTEDLLDAWRSTEVV